MVPEVSLSLKLVTADSALIGSLSCVDSIVDLEVTLFVKTLVAVVTFEGFVIVLNNI